MVLAVALAIVVLLLVLFITLTLVERKSGTRAFAPLRARLDYVVSELATRVRRIYVSAFAYERMRVLAIHIAHGIAHQVLIVVRILERFLTNVVRRIRRKKEIESIGTE